MVKIVMSCSHRILIETKHHIKKHLSSFNEMMQRVDRWCEEVFTTSLVNPMNNTKLKLVGFFVMLPIVQTDMTFRVFPSHSLVNKRIHAGSIVMGFCLRSGEDAVACPAW